MKVVALLRVYVEQAREKTVAGAGTHPVPLTAQGPPTPRAFRSVCL